MSKSNLEGRRPKAKQNKEQDKQTKENIKMEAKIKKMQLYLFYWHTYAIKAYELNVLFIDDYGQTSVYYQRWLLDLIWYQRISPITPCEIIFLFTNLIDVCLT